MTGIFIVLIDCENLTGRQQLAAGFRWRGFDRVELFGRASHLARWRQGLARFGVVPTAEVPVPDDAPPQAADTAIQGRVGSLLAGPPLRVVIASNDSDFDPDIRRLKEAGIAAIRQGDCDAAGVLALVVAELARDGWADAGPVGERMAKDFALPLKGRLAALAAKAGVPVMRSSDGRVRLGAVK